MIMGDVWLLWSLAWFGGKAEWQIHCRLEQMDRVEQRLKSIEHQLRRIVPES
jgi:hypothetical protein